MEDIVLKKNFVIYQKKYEGFTLNIPSKPSFKKETFVRRIEL